MNIVEEINKGEMVAIMGSSGSGKYCFYFGFRPFFFFSKLSFVIFVLVSIKPLPGHS